MLSYIFLFVFLTIQWSLILYYQFVYIIYILIFHYFFSIARFCALGYEISLHIKDS